MITRTDSKVINNPVYQEEYKRQKADSQILNGEDRTNAYSIFNTQENVKSLLYELVGDANGLYKRTGDTYTAHLPFYQQKLNDLEYNFEVENVRRRNVAKPEFDEMNGEFLEQKMRVLATIDVLLEEKDLLEATLKKFVEKETEKEEADILKFGLRCSCQLKDGKLHLIDGQRVAETSDGIKYIANGPLYAGLGVQEYRQLSDKWLKERRHHAANKLNRINNELQEAGRSTIKQLPFKSLSRVNLNELPPFPKDAINYLKQQVVAK
jgi:hypothetical protein